MPSLKCRRASAVASAALFELEGSASAASAARGIGPSRQTSRNAGRARERIASRYHVLWLFGAELEAACDVRAGLGCRGTTQISGTRDAHRQAGRDADATAYRLRDRGD